MTVKRYKYEENVWENFACTPIKRYERSMLMDISQSDGFTSKEKVWLNYKIVVPISEIVEKTLIDSIPLSKEISKHRKEIAVRRQNQENRK
jgi:hypothetical protein